MIDAPDRQLLVLVASHAEWLGRSLESVIQSNGYAVVRVEEGNQAYELALRTDPDALILDGALPGKSGIDVLRALRSSPTFDPTIPIFITAPGPASNRERSEAYAAGAWDFCSHPVDTQTLLAKLSTYVRARQRVRLADAATLVDPGTGLYTAEGLRQWAAKLAAQARRQHEPLACVMVAPSGVEAADALPPLEPLAEFCREQSRASDVVGYVGDNRFAILAPHTDVVGAQGLIERLERAHVASVRRGPQQPLPAIRTAFYAVPDFAEAGIQPDDVVARAMEALRLAMGGHSASGDSILDSPLAS